MLVSRTIPYGTPVVKRHRLFLSVALFALACASCRTADDSASAVPAPAFDPARDCVPLEEMPDPLLYVPKAPEDGSPGKAYDLACHEWGKSVRANDPERAAQAVRDAAWGVEDFCKLFSPAFGRTISEKETPALCEMIRFGLRTVRHSYRKIKNGPKRLRPFVELGESTMMPADDAGLGKSSSYPSGHAANGWALALLLSEVRPSAAEALLSRGLAYGESRVIVGAHWRSDVDAGRIAGAAAVARLHADPQFRALMDAARAECGD